MKHVVCTFKDDQVIIKRYDRKIGVVAFVNKVPTIVLENDAGTGCVKLTANDIDIIWDNWDALQEMKNEKVET